MISEKLIETTLEDEGVSEVSEYPDSVYEDDGEPEEAECFVFVGRELEGEQIHEGAYCDECGKAQTEREYSCGQCDCGGSVADEAELMEDYSDAQYL